MCDGSRGGRSGNAGGGPGSQQRAGEWLGSEGGYKGSQTNTPRVPGWGSGVFLVLLLVPQMHPRVSWFVSVPGEPCRPLSSTRRSMESKVQAFDRFQVCRQERREWRGKGQGCWWARAHPCAIPLGACVLSWEFDSLLRDNLSDPKTGVIVPQQ